MPYQSTSQLPDSVKDNLPKHAQDIYKEAFNSAWDEYASPSDRRVMTAARKLRIKSLGQR